MFSALRTGRLYPPPPGDIPGTNFCQRVSRPQGHSAAGRMIMSMTYSNDTIWNRTRDLSACSAVPQPTAPPRAPSSLNIFCIFCCLDLDHIFILLYFLYISCMLLESVYVFLSPIFDQLRQFSCNTGFRTFFFFYTWRRRHIALATT